MFKIFLFTAFLLSNYAQADLIIFSEGFDPHANLVADFEAATGEKVILRSADFKDNLGLLKDVNKPESLALPNALKPDLVIAKDLVYLAQVKELGFTQSFDDLPAFSKLKTGMKDADNHWVALTYRARTLAYRSDVDVSNVNTYEDLANSEWAGRLCLRTSNSSYNYGLVSYLVAQYGEPKAKDILLGWMDNLAQPVYTGDTVILTALNAGECDVALVNHYYLAREYEKAAGQGQVFNVNVKYLNQGQGGTHVNGYGVALLNTSEQKVLAQKFVEMLLSEKAQLQISTSQFAFPAVEGLKAETLIESWGDFEASPLMWSEIGNQIPIAKKLMLETKYE